jgi:formylglycine-generating enzyme required for sulfatase activity
VKKIHTSLSGTLPLQYWSVGDYFLGRFEVTNAEFKAFVDAGGYDDRDLFAELDDLSFARAKSAFVDRTGRQGPAGWRLANFAEGEERKPVTGISWYEATAFARFRGEQLPTAVHWSHAGRNVLDAVSAWRSVQTEAGNFSGAVRDVGGSGVIDPFGTFDMVGNVREWVANTAGGRRAVLGGSYRDPSYMLGYTVALDPWTRDGVTGFRTMRVANAALDQAALLADVGTVPMHSTDVRTRR